MAEQQVGYKGCEEEAKTYARLWFQNFYGAGLPWHEKQVMYQIQMKFEELGIGYLLDQAVNEEQEQ